MALKFYLFILIFTVTIKTCYLFGGVPITISMKKDWELYDSQPIGSILGQAKVNSPVDVTFTLEPSRGIEKLPFMIESDSGVIRLTHSLKGRAGEEFYFYVLANDGKLDTKLEVRVQISDTSGHSNFNSRPPNPFQPTLDDVRQSLPINNFPGFLNNNPPYIQQTINNYRPPIDNVQPTLQLTNTNPKVFKQQNTYVVSTTINPPQDFEYLSTTVKSIKLIPIDPPVDPTTTTAKPNLTSTTSEHPIVVERIDNNSLAIGSPVTIIIVVVACIFLIAGALALYVFRRHFCTISKLLKKKSKEEMTKKSNLSTISGNLTEDSSQNSIGMQHWNGPLAYNNRYVPGWTDRENNQLTTTNNVISSTPDSNENNTMTINFKKTWDFPRHRLKFYNILGEGAFGQVWRCEATNIDGYDGLQTVAVKTLKENATEAEKNDLLSELQVMKRLEPHVNVVRLLGCCIEKEPIFVILEYVNKGKLQSYLRNSRAERNYGNMHGKSKTLTSGDLTSFMYQVARGMDFLTSRGIIHRDLAARNILITDDHTCKVADFGFARDVITSKIYERKSEGRLPIRWMAIESLYDNLFSLKSDIWSFGILMWEIVTLGSTPYPGMAAADVMKHVRDGKRLEKPDHCRRELYNIMFYCWARLPEERPTFSEVVNLLDKLLLTETDYIELERFPDHNYYNMMGMSGEKL